MSISPYVFPILKHKLIPKEMMKRMRVSFRLQREDVINALMQEFDLPEDFFTRRTRKRTYNEPRKIYCKIAVFHMHKKRVDVAKEIEGYDHTVVIHACNTFDVLYESDAHFKERVDGVYSRLGITNT